MTAARMRERVCSWGGAICSEALVGRPTTVEEIREHLVAAGAEGWSIGLRGAGQSYGDAALNADNVVLDLTRMSRVLAWDPETGTIRVEPGVTIAQLWQHVLPYGFWPWVVPGTMRVTVGGATAMNVHGKNHWKVGTFGEHVREFRLLLASGEIVRCSREENADLFQGAIGGFGMLGCLVDVTLQVKRVRSGLLRVEPLVGRDLAEMVALLEERRETADYLVGWIDPLARGRALGRGLVHQACEITAEEDPTRGASLQREAQQMSPRALGVVPLGLAWRAMRPVTNDVGIRIVNRGRYDLGRLGAGRRHLESLARFHFPLDRVPDWKRAFGRHGLMQYQTFVPAAAAPEVFRSQLERCQAAGLPPYVGYFKRHRVDEFLVSYGVDGFSLGLDFRVTAANRTRLWALARELDALVVAAGGRFYFAKDGTLTPGSLAPLLAEERMQRFLALKRRVDPNGLFATDLSRRLFGAVLRAGA